MPTYDYRCAACKHEFELFQSMSEPKKRKCPECGKLQLERLIGAGAAVLFKGSGFYETDYRSDSYKKAAKADSKPDTPSGSGGDAKPDAKPDTKPDTKPAGKPGPSSEPGKAKADSPKPTRQGKSGGKAPGE